MATLKHFLGYSGVTGRPQPGARVRRVRARWPTSILPPFEMALRAGARSVMNSYTDIDGVPSAADPSLLTTLLRDSLGFTGTVAADYFSVAFLETLHHVAASPGEAAGLALAAGIDVELPSVNTFGEPLLAAVRDGTVDEKLVDRALDRVLRQKCELGLLDPGWAPAEPDDVDLDDAESRAIALELARRSVVLLANDGTLPLRAGARVAVVGPRADTHEAMLGCYSFPMHVLVHYPDVDPGLEILHGPRSAGRRLRRLLRPRLSGARWQRRRHRGRRGDGGGRGRLRGRAGRPGGALRQRHVRRGLRRRGPAAPRAPGGAPRGAARRPALPSSPCCSSVAPTT